MVQMKPVPAAHRKFPCSCVYDINFLGLRMNEYSRNKDVEPRKLAQAIIF